MRALVPLADGSEEIEAITIINVLRRADIDVDVATLNESKSIKGSRDIVINGTKTLVECMDTDYDLIALPGGLEGVENLRDSNLLIKKLKEQKESKRLYAAICAAPAIVLEPHGLLDGRKATCYPCFQLKPEHQCEKPDPEILISENLITSRGPGTAMSFSIQLVRLLQGDAVANRVAAGLLVTE